MPNFPPNYAEQESYYASLENLIIGDWLNKKCLTICEFSISKGINVPESWIVKDQKTGYFFEFNDF